MANDENKIILEFPATNVEIEFGETITFDNISGFLDSDRVTYNDESLTEEIAHLENDKADETYVDEQVDLKMDKVNPTGTGSFSLNRKANTTVGSYSVTTGYRNTASGTASHAESWQTTASGDASHAEGESTIASAYAAHSEGETTTASGDDSHAEGKNSTASGNVSHAEGENNTASGYGSHAEGYGNTASGLMAHAEGVTTESSGYGSHSEGVGTIANHIGQHVIGTYNVADTSTADPTAKGNYIEIVGNGTDDNRRRNARTLDWSGNETLMGDLTYNGNKSLTSEISRLDGKIDTKANASDVYTKSQADTLLNGKANASDVYTKQATDALLNDKADVSDLPDMSQYYDKSEVDDLLDDKANSDDVYGKAYIDTALSGKANVGTSYTKSEEDALLANKADKSDTYTKEQVDDIVYNILPGDTASGSVANFETDLALPLKSLEIDVNAKQDLHGYDHPWPAGGGKNKLDMKVYNGGSYNVPVGTQFTLKESSTQFTKSGNNYTASTSSAWKCFTVYAPVKSNSSYYLGYVFSATGATCGYSMYLLDEDYKVLTVYNNTENPDTRNWVITTTNDTAYVCIVFTNRWTAVNTLTISEPQLVLSSSSTAYEPYSNICPISGWNEIRLVHCGTNLWDEEWELGYYSSTGAKVSATNQLRTINKIMVKPNTDYYFKIPVSGYNAFSVIEYDEKGEFLRMVTPSSYSGDGAIYTTSSDCHYFNINIGSSYGNVYLNNISINYPSSDTQYHAYNGNTEVINLGGTYYGGHFTQDKDGHRQFEVTHGYIVSYNGEVINEPWISSMDEYSQGATPTTGAQVVYPLATPIEVQLTAQQIEAIVGTNNIYADTGDCAVEFKVSVEQYVSNHSGGSLGSSLRGSLLGSNPNTDESERQGEE